MTRREGPAVAELLTGIEGVSSRPVRRIVLLAGDDRAGVGGGQSRFPEHSRANSPKAHCHPSDQGNCGEQ
jgi:hypothetical protein